MAEKGWWAVRFKMDWFDSGTPWEKDLLLAHRTLAPILSAEAPHIDLWRFHRRSNNDAAGHQFSFIFYSSAATADRINRRVLANARLKHLLVQGTVRQIITDDVAHNDRPAVADTSDSSWSPTMRATWPYYIMGVSRMWLAMVEQVSGQLSGDQALPADDQVDELLAHYQAVNAEITRIWQKEGYHALLHHLNAIYGYEALMYWEKRWKSF
ncbi:hypothetical protein JCM12296A_05660 [Desulfosarcina cetonica]